MSGFWPRPEVLDRLTGVGDAVIEASAGTGKTYTLEHLVIELVLKDGLGLDQILVVTFTEKAAAELALRLRSAMSRILAGPWPATEGWRIDETAKQRLRQALTSFDAASISTIHAFCKRMLTEHAFMNGRLFQEELIDGRAAFQDAFYDVVRRVLATDARLHPYLTAWLQTDSLDALTDRLFEAHTRGGSIYPPYDPEALTEALRDLSRRELTPAVLKPTLQRAGIRGSPVQAFLNRIKALRTILETFARDSDPAGALAALGQEEDKRQADGGLVPYLRSTIAPAADDIPRLAQLNDALGALARSTIPLDSAIVQVALPLVRAAVVREKRAQGRFDFDDMLRLVDEALQGPAQDALLATLRRRFRVALIDEFQDTDEVQWSIFRRIFADSQDHRLVVIGDPKQAIYGFRGADVETYLDARAYLTSDRGALRASPVVHLTNSYRSTEALADAINQLLDQRRPTPFFTGPIQYDHPVTAAGRPPVLEIAGRPASPVVVWAIEPKRATLSPSAAARALNERIAREIQRLLTDGRWVDDDGVQRPVEASDIFVLTRTAKEGLETARALRSSGLPHAFYRQDGLFQTQEAEDVRHLLAAIANPHDRGRRLRTWIGPFFAVPLERARNGLALSGSHPLVASLFRFRGLADDKRWARLFNEILSQTGIIQRELLLADSERELTNYLHIFEILLDEALRHRGTLTDLLHTLGAFIGGRRLPEGEDGNIQRLESERSSVQIMTQHKAKGLEAPVVFLTGGLDRNPGFAHVYHDDGQRRLHLGEGPPLAAIKEREEEDQRLAYVALTRAKNRLYLPFYGGRTRPVLQRLVGTYAVIDRALESVLADPEHAGFEVERLPEKSPSHRQRRSMPPGRVSGTVSVRWPERLPVPDLGALKTEQRGAIMTSYSRIKETQGGYLKMPVEEELGEEHRLSRAETPSDQLPGGTASGRFIHEMLELVDLDVIRRQAGWSFWSARDDVQELFRRGIRRYDRRVEHLSHSYQLVYTALTTPIRLGDVDLTEGIAGAQRILREMEFLYAVPESTKATANRGYVKGFIDVVIEHDERVMVLDWKTDLLPDYDPKTLTAHVEANYALQASLYTVAMVRLLGIEDAEAYRARFGGTAYVFVRGFDPTGRGVFFTRPEWSAITATFERLTSGDIAGVRS